LNYQPMKFRKELISSLEKQHAAQFTGPLYTKESTSSYKQTTEFSPIQAFSYEREEEKHIDYLNDDEESINFQTDEIEAHQKSEGRPSTSNLKGQYVTVDLIGGGNMAQYLVEEGQVQQEIQKKKGYIWAFGKNGDGELGIANQKDSFLPKSIQLNVTAVKMISSGSHHSALVSKNGEIYVCGSQLHGKLGISNLSSMHLPKFMKVAKV